MQRHAEWASVFFLLQTEELPTFTFSLIVNRPSVPFQTVSYKK